MTLPDRRLKQCDNCNIFVKESDKDCWNCHDPAKTFNEVINDRRNDMDDTQAYTDNPGALRPTGLRPIGNGIIGSNLNDKIQDMKALANLTNRLEEAVEELQKSVELLDIKTIPLRVMEDRATTDSETAKPLQSMSPLAQRLDNLLYAIHIIKYQVQRLTNEIDY